MNALSIVKISMCIVYYYILHNVQGALHNVQGALHNVQGVICIKEFVWTIMYKYYYH